MTNKSSPTEVSKLALHFISLCQEDVILMNKVYRAAITLMDADPLQGAASTSVAAGPLETKKEKPSEKNPSSSALTPDEVKTAKAEFRANNGLSGNLTPSQVKIAKAIFRDKKTRGGGHQAITPVKSGVTNNNSKVIKPKTVDDPSKRLEAPKSQQVGDGSRSTWNTKLKAQKQRALEKGIIMIDEASTDRSWFFKADYYNARTTLEDTWNRFKNTWNCSGKKDPLEELPPMPSLEDIRKEFHDRGIKLRCHESGQIILQDETTSQSLRPVY
jgi:hypothetical protein